MRNFQDTFETRKRSFISAFLICMTVPLINLYFLRLCFRMLVKPFLLKKHVCVTITPQHSNHEIFSACCDILIPNKGFEFWQLWQS